MKKFLVINTSFFGDTLLTNPLCRNIKALYPESHITFIVNKPFVEVATYCDGVDEVVAYDKKGKHHGLKGAWHFYQEHKEHFKLGFEAAFVIYGNERGIILAKLFGAKKIYAENQGMINLLLDNPKNINYHGKTKVQTKNSILLEQYTHEPIQEMPMIFLPPKSAYREINALLESLGLQENNKLVAICTTSKRKEKDMPISDCQRLIKQLRNQGYVPLLLGAGAVASKYRDDLQKIANGEFIDLVDKTSISQLGALLANCRALISVDTGTMHLGLAIAVPTICLFYIHTKEHLAAWAPEKELYRSIVLTENINVENIMGALKQLTE